MGNYIYIGETIPSLGIRRNMVIFGDTPLPQIQSLIDLHPMLRVLYIPTSECAVARKNVRIEGTIENVAFAETVKIRRRKERNE